MAKYLLILSIIFIPFFSNFVFAKEIPFEITPSKKISTSNYKVSEGDIVEFKVINDVTVNNKICLSKNQKIYGIITSREENGFLGKPASLYIESFYITKNGIRTPYQGVILKKGTNHDVITGFAIFENIIVLIRGGEAILNPDKDKFTLFLEGK